jgi:hypothetical protein
MHSSLAMSQCVHQVMLENIFFSNFLMMCPTSKAIEAEVVNKQYVSDSYREIFNT